MRFLLITALFAFQTLCASGPIPSFFDGIETAKKITDHRSKTSQTDLANQDYKDIQRAKAAQFDLACKDYYDALKATPRLSSDDEPEILAGYLEIANFFYEKRNQAAINNYKVIMEKPNQAHYQDLLKKLQVGGSPFKSAFERNFGLSLINLLERTREEARQNLLLFYRRKSSDSVSEEQNIKMTKDLEIKTTEIAHRIMSGSFGGARTANTSEKQVMTSFLLDAAQGVIDREEDISDLLKNYDIKYAQDQHDKGKLTKHIAICRTLLASVHYLLSNKVRVLNAKAKDDIKALLGPTWDSALVEKVVFGPQVLEFLEDRLGYFKMEEIKSAPVYETINKEETCEELKDIYPQQDLNEVFESLDPRHHISVIQFILRTSR